MKKVFDKFSFFSGRRPNKSKCEVALKGVLKGVKMALWGMGSINRTSDSSSSHPEVFLRKGVLKTCSKSTREHPWRSVVSIKLLYNFTEIKLRHECSSVNLLHIFRIPFLKNTSGRLLLRFHKNFRNAFFL